jgi:hypothetical protein
VRRTILPIAAVLLTAACSTIGHTPPAVGSVPSRASASPSATGVAPPNASVLTEDSTCAEYLRIEKNARYAFIAHELQTHQPQTQVSISLSSEFAPSAKPTVIDGNRAMNTVGAGFLGGILDDECPHKLSAKILALLAPAWTSSSKP